jgi:hypothetical protein
MTAPTPSSIPASSPLTEEQLHQLANANVALRKVQRAVSIARFDGWTVAIFAALTALFGITDPVTLLIALVMACMGVIELHGARRLQRLDARAARTLGLNQLALGALVILYALAHVYAELSGPGVYDSLAAADPQLSQMLQPVKNLTHSIALAAYTSLILVAFVAQGGLARFYFSRRKLIDAYLLQTPPWITAVQRTGITA